MGPVSNEDPPPDQNGVGGPSGEMRYREDTSANYQKAGTKGRFPTPWPTLFPSNNPLTSGVMAGEVVRVEHSDGNLGSNPV